MPRGHGDNFCVSPTFFYCSICKNKKSKKRGLTRVRKCDIISMFENRWCGSMAEQLICNQQVVGSTPITSSSDIRRLSRRSILESISYGSVPEWPKGTDCKSAGNAFGGPNPPAPTTKSTRPCGGCFFVLSAVFLRNAAWSEERACEFFQPNRRFGGRIAATCEGAASPATGVWLSARRAVFLFCREH